MISPKTFIKYVLDENKIHQDVFKVNEHWRPQAYTCPFCSFNYTVYGKFESLHEDSAYILQKTNLTSLKAVGKVNADVHKFDDRSQRRKTFWSQVPVQYLEELKECFKVDFELFYPD